MNSIEWLTLVPVVVYFAAMYAIGFYASAMVNRASKRKGGSGSAFLEEYMIGGRSTGGFVLAMTLVSTYLSAGSFIGGPGTAYRHGLAWVFLAMAQIPTGYYTLMVLGKKFAIVSRKTGANSISDFLRQRYESKAVLIIASLSIIFFLIAAIAAQLIGASRLLQGSTGLDYKSALLFFAVTVIVHTAVGGYRGVAFNGTLQGIVMTCSTVALFAAVVINGGGIANIIQTMKAMNPNTISPFGVQEGFMTVPWVSSFWVLVGFAVIGLPAVSQRAMSYKDTQSMHSAIVYGSVVSLLLLMGMHLVGAFGVTQVSGISAGDLVVPTLIKNLFHPLIAGIVLAGPLAAAMSTVDSQLLVVVAAIVNDLLVNYIRPELKTKAKTLRRLTFFTCSVVGLITIALAFNPPDLMVWLNLFATAGQLSTFLWPTILGLYWKGANAQGALASMVVGIGSYLVFNYYVPRPLALHPIVPSLVLSLIAFVIVSQTTKKPSERVIRLFWEL
ncbi:sodium/pantothenate symporter [Jonquetella sp. BV3C21]|uniref:sodium/pantothenate symporter n=1 Tax=Jonquetella sp. BV3C21 TaxID=1111126 RepID=UPI0003AE70A9|nr:sodium/pantothenate symporter [Jonquetella sp. BV3C21]ERL23698.1 sodium/pantothenate symporter [Jonquetella sp. BV3C21]